MEGIKTQTPKPDSSFEIIKGEISKKLEKAEKNPLDINRFEELEKQISEQSIKFEKTGFKTAEDLALDEKIKQEILSHGAIVDTLPEFEDMLNQVPKKYNREDGWARDLLAHENAHANVSAELGHEHVGYGLFYISENDKIISIQPAHLNEDPKNITPMELIGNKIKILEAPEKYGNKMSSADISERDVELKKQQAEVKRQQDLAEVRASLGLK